jgi:hypothetical protein
MNDDKSDQASTDKQVETTTECGPGCNCGSSGIGTKWKVIICVVVAIAAAAVSVRAYMRKAESNPVQGQESYTIALPAATSSTGDMTRDAKMNQAGSSLWGEPLKSLASLNQVAKDKDAVLVCLLEKGQKLNREIQKEIETATSKAGSGGMVMAYYMLDEDSPDYSKVIGQVPAPCVLAIVKGKGSSVVSGEITEGKLLQAIVTASRPSGSCGPSSGSGCCPAPAKRK